MKRLDGSTAQIIDIREYQYRSDKVMWEDEKATVADPGSAEMFSRVAVALVILCVVVGVVVWRWGR